MNATDDDGNAVNFIAHGLGGLGAVAGGYALSCFSGSCLDDSWGDAAVDFSSGALGLGAFKNLSKAGKAYNNLRKAEKIPATDFMKNVLKDQAKEDLNDAGRKLIFIGFGKKGYEAGKDYIESGFPDAEKTSVEKSVTKTLFAPDSKDE